MTQGWRRVMIGAALCLLAVVLHYGVVFQGQLPDHRWITGYNDLILHAGAFLVLSLPLLVLWPVWRVAAGLTLLAGAIEVAQVWLPRRTPGWDDFAASLAGLLVGIVCVAGLRTLNASR